MVSRAAVFTIDALGSSLLLLMVHHVDISPQLLLLQTSSGIVRCYMARPPWATCATCS